MSTPQGLDLSVAPGPRVYETGSPIRVTAVAADGRILARADARVMAIRNGAAGAAAVVPLRWADAELAAAVRVDVVDDHDGNPDTPNVVIGHWATGIAPPALGGLPAGFEAATAHSVFAATGSVDEVAGAYLRARFPDYPAPRVKAQRAQTRAGRAYVGWSTGDDTGSIATGTVLLRPADGGWEVLASTTDGIDLSDLRVEEGSVRGEIRSTEANSLFADVLRGDGTPVAGSARPGGYGDAHYSFGSAAGPGDGMLRLDVATDDPVPIVRVNTVGGTILSVSEVRLSPLG